MGRTTWIIGTNRLDREQKLTFESDFAIILLLNAWMLFEPLVEKLPPIGWQQLQYQFVPCAKHGDTGLTFQSFISRMTPVLILLNDQPRGRLTCCCASHHACPWPSTHPHVGFCVPRKVTLFPPLKKNLHISLISKKFPSTSRAKISPGTWEGLYNAIRKAEGRRI